MSEEVPSFHTIGIGAGPANLSLAAMFDAVAPHRIALFERHPRPDWHSALLFPAARMQTSWLKDLVSLVDPCHRLTFLNYLVSTGRVYALLTSQYDVIPREEYARYLAWASDHLENIEYGVAIDRIGFEDDGFSAYSQGLLVGRSDHLVLGTGTDPYVSPGFTGLLGPDVFVPESLLSRVDDMSADLSVPVAVVGGGQTGAECVLELLGRGFRRILWFGRRQWFAPIDDSPPANEHFRPAYLNYLREVSPFVRQSLVKDATLTADAITPGVLQVIYQANYAGMLRHGEFPLTLFPARDVVGGERDGDHVLLNVRGPESRRNGGPDRGEILRARYVIVATGRRPVPPPLDPALLARIEPGPTGGFALNDDFSVRWDGGYQHKIYARHDVRASHGLAASNLTMLPVVSAEIINSLFEKEIFTVRDDLVSTNWG